MSEKSQPPEEPKASGSKKGRGAAEKPADTTESAEGETTSKESTDTTGAGVSKSYEDWGKSLDQLSKAFTASARRWELIVYPSLFAFVLLAAYGFFLIYSLTKDIGRVADTMDSINTDMHSVAESMETITQDMHRVAINMNSVSQNMVIMTQTVDNQSATMREMAFSMRGMNVSMAQMRYDISILNTSVSRPMSFMNSFMPW